MMFKCDKSMNEKELTHFVRWNCLIRLRFFFVGNLRTFVMLQSDRWWTQNIRSEVEKWVQVAKSGSLFTRNFVFSFKALNTTIIVDSCVHDKHFPLQFANKYWLCNGNGNKLLEVSSHRKSLKDFLTQSAIKLTSYNLKYLSCFKKKFITL